MTPKDAGGGPSPLHLTEVLQPRGPAAAIVLTDAQVAALTGGPKTAPVKVTVNGRHTFDLRIARMGGENLVGFNREVRTAAGVEAGDRVELVIVADGTERTVEVPDDLHQAMTAAGVDARFAELAPSHRKEYVRWIVEAKRPETRANRVEQAVQRIAEGKPRR